MGTFEQGSPMEVAKINPPSVSKQNLGQCPLSCQSSATRQFFSTQNNQFRPKAWSRTHEKAKK